MLMAWLPRIWLIFQWSMKHLLNWSSELTHKQRLREYYIWRQKTCFFTNFAYHTTIVHRIHLEVKLKWPVSLACHRIKSHNGLFKSGLDPRTSSVPKLHTIAIKNWDLDRDLNLFVSSVNISSQYNVAIREIVWIGTRTHTRIRVCVSRKYNSIPFKNLQWKHRYISAQ